jgi:hypothetical protein
MSFLQKLEKKIGKYSIRNLTKYIILTYVIGYVLMMIEYGTGAPIREAIGLNPDAILHGQIWRIVSWVLIPPSSFDVFTIIMLICYYQLGTLLERVWGDFLYNVYIFGGLIMTLIGSFVLYFIFAVPGNAFVSATNGYVIGQLFSTYYVSLSIFLGFAMTFPEQQMLLFFIIPIKIKWLALVDVAYLAYEIINSVISMGFINALLVIVPIICSLAATIVFFVMTRKYQFGQARRNFQDRKRQREFQKAMSRGQSQRNNVYGNNGARHKCCICGRTELDDPNLEFRFCSKCNGNYEYCQDHLFTHVHKT